MAVKPSNGAGEWADGKKKREAKVKPWLRSRE